MKRSELAGRRIAILGCGREGRAAWRWLRAAFPDMPLTLLAEQPPDADIVLDPALDTLAVGPLADAGLERFEVLVRSPGIPLRRPELGAAEAAGARHTSGTNIWFSEHPGATTVVITGTKGKSTTAALSAHLLEAAGRDVVLAGNIGRPLLDAREGAEVYVIELSSYQLADFDGQATLGALLNLSPEHLDWHGSAEAYFHDKLRLATHAERLVANAADPALRAALGARPDVRWFNDDEGFAVAGERLLLGGQPLELDWPDALRGAHNRANLAAALSVVRELGVEAAEVLDALARFRGLPHRQQVLGERDGRLCVNVSLATTPVATAAALAAWGDRPVVLLVGGFDRGLDWRPLAEELKASPPHAVIGLPDSGPAILRVLDGAGVTPPAGLHAVADLDEGVARALELAPRGGVVLLSPGAPSFPCFRDYRERGQRFAEACELPLQALDLEG